MASAFVTGGQTPTELLVSPAEFRRMLTSRRRLIRVDEVDRGRCVLIDPDTGERFAVDRDALLASGAARR
jgi:hypothetical protein